MGRVEEKSAIVTGGALGIGKATAERLAKEGAQVAVTDVKDEEGTSVVESIEADGGTARYWHMDVSDEDEVARVFDEVADAFGEERIANTKTGSITSVQAVYVPADDFTDPAVTHTFTHLSASIVLSRDRASQGLYPAIDPLQSSSNMLTPHVVGERHYRVARTVRETLAEYKDLKDIIAMLGMEELSRPDQRTVNRAPPRTISHAALRRDRAVYGSPGRGREPGRHNPRLRAHPERRIQ